MVEISDFRHPGGWPPERATARGRECAEQLEQGCILCLGNVPFELPRADVDFLLGLQAAESRFHKNISYRPTQDVLRGFEGSGETVGRAHDIMRRYSGAVAAFTGALLPGYAPHFTLDYASFRQNEEAGRALSHHKRNDLLHVDAFPSRPTRGSRILRVFTNLNPSAPRVWQAGLPFVPLAEQYACAAGLAGFARSPGAMAATARGVLRALGVPAAQRSPYDRFMLHFHDWMKDNAAVQAELPRAQVEFSPMTTWLVFTDGVPHAVISGRFALEQTFIVPLEAMALPGRSPLRTLERLAHAALL